VVGLAIAGSVFITHATEQLSVLFPGVSPQLVSQAIAGTNAAFLKSLPSEVQADALDIVVKCMDRVYILGITGGAVAVVCGLLFTQKKLDLNAAAGGI